MADPFFEYDWARSEVSDLLEVDSRRHNRVRTYGFTEHLGLHLPSVQVFCHYDR